MTVTKYFCEILFFFFMIMIGIDHFIAEKTLRGWEKNVMDVDIQTNWCKPYLTCIFDDIIFIRANQPLGLEYTTNRLE